MRKNFLLFFQHTAPKSWGEILTKGVIGMTKDKGNSLTTKLGELTSIENWEKFRAVWTELAKFPVKLSRCQELLCGLIHIIPEIRFKEFHPTPEEAWERIAFLIEIAEDNMKESLDIYSVKNQVGQKAYEILLKILGSKSSNKLVSVIFMEYNCLRDNLQKQVQKENFYHEGLERLKIIINWFTDSRAKFDKAKPYSCLAIEIMERLYGFYLSVPDKYKDSNDAKLLQQFFDAMINTNSYKLMRYHAHPMMLPIIRKEAIQTFLKNPPWLVKITKALKNDEEALLKIGLIYGLPTATLYHQILAALELKEKGIDL